MGVVDRVLLLGVAHGRPESSREKVYLGPDPFGLGGFQVAFAAAVSAPSSRVIRDLFTACMGRRQIQLVVAAVHNGTV